MGAKVLIGDRPEAFEHLSLQPLPQTSLFFNQRNINHSFNDAVKLKNPGQIFGTEIALRLKRGEFSMPDINKYAKHRIEYASTPCGKLIPRIVYLDYNQQSQGCPVTIQCNPFYWWSTNLRNAPGTGYKRAFADRATVYMPNLKQVHWSSGQSQTVSSTEWQWDSPGRLDEQKTPPADIYY